MSETFKESMKNKQELIDYVKSLPEDLEWCRHNMKYDAVDVRIFANPKDNEFYEWYFGV